MTSVLTMDSWEEDSPKPARTSTEDAQTVAKAKDKIFSQSAKYFPIFSRYGRTIKPKSPSTILIDFPKNTKMPKFKQEASMEDDSLKIEDNSLIMDDSSNNIFDISLKNEDEKINHEDLQTKSQWKLGQLVWARIGNFPFWPSIVTLNPSSRIFVTVKGKSKLLHVRYCADKDRHSWVPFGSIIPFTGLEDFEKKSKEITPEIKKKEPKYAAAFLIKAAVKLQWDDAVAEATGLMAKSIEKRIELFNPDNKEKNSVNKSLNSSSKTDENVKKRKILCCDEAVSKKSKLQNGEIYDLERLENKAIIASLSIETPPTPPSSHKDSSDEAPTKFKSKKGLNKDGKEGVFEIFCERQREYALELDPEASEADIKAFLYDSWNKMNASDRGKYRADYLQEDDIRMYGLDGEEDEEDNDSDSEERSAKKRRSKADLSRIKEEASDQEETTSVESENLEKTVRRRRTKPRRESSDRDEVISIESDDKPVIKNKKSKATKDDINGKEDTSSLIVDLAKRRAYKLFKGMKNERVCQICEQPGKLIRCKGPCYSYFHLDCVKPGDSSPEPSEAGDSEENPAYLEDLEEIKIKTKENNQKAEDIFDDENFRCIDCLSGIAPPCFVCHERDAERFKCSVIACGKHYHVDCLKHWPQVQWQGERLNCPYHICHTCSSDDPQNGHPRAANERFVRCVRCPSTYHASIACLPAGSNIMTASQIVCPKHYKSPHPPVNATWCFLCTEGGSLICCDTCPMSFHLECLGIEAPDGAYICEDCETGRLPLYGEVVWVKLGTYRWWPSVICYPQEIPTNIAQKQHKVGEFCVMFLGSRDYYWIHRGKAFLFQDGDTTAKQPGSKKVDHKKEELFKRAVEEAKVIHEQLNIEKDRAKDRDNNSRHLKPPPYVKLKVNKPVGNVKIPEADSMVACNCDPSKPNPCAPDSDCLNRILMTECSPDACPAGTKCQNQLFVQRKYPAMKPIHTQGRGWGLRSLEFISEGQFIIEYVGEIIDEAEYRLRIQQKQERKSDNYYFLTIDNNRMIDAEPKGNLSRFMNHSCLPNCETQKWTVNGDTRIGLFALRNIQAGEELTFNYNLSCDGETKKPCLCKAPNCSGFIGLKASKQQMSLVQDKKMEKPVRKYKRNKKTALFCWSCNGKINNNESVLRCDQKTCGKVYHPACLDLEDGSDEQVFHCPWHFCAECFKRTALRCIYCCNAFCQLHTQGNVYEHPETGNFICYKHPLECPNYVEMDMGGEALMDEAGEGLMDGMEEDVPCSEDHILLNGHAEMEEPMGASSPKATSRPDETSPRGTIVEVQPSSEEGEESADISDSISSVGKKKRGRKRKLHTTVSDKKQQQQNDSDFTVDQIAAIIGIVK